MKCPRCQSPLDDDFGMVICAKCGEMVLMGEEAKPKSGLKPPPPPDQASDDFSQMMMDELSEDPEARSPLDPIPTFDSNPDTEAAPQTRSESDGSVVIEGYEGSPQDYGQPQDPMQEITDYGNSEISQATDGLLLFDVVIEGIDTNDIRAEVAAVLGDKRFLWNAESLMASIRNGKLMIRQINSIKASLLIKRLKHLDVSIRWEQYAITDARV